MSVRGSMAAPGGRFQLLYDVARSITTFTELDPLLRFATRRARELLRAEGCAILLLDRRRGALLPGGEQGGQPRGDGHHARGDEFRAARRRGRLGPARGT